MNGALENWHLLSASTYDPLKHRVMTSAIFITLRHFNHFVRDVLRNENSSRSDSQRKQSKMTNLVMFSKAPRYDRMLMIIW